MNKVPDKSKKKMSKYDKIKEEIYARGNKWEIENFEALNGKVEKKPKIWEVWKNGRFGKY